jgi:8-oxo-dGTP diphosphatase
MAKASTDGPIKFAVLAADTVIFTIRGGELFVRLIRVDRPPFFVQAKGFPGGLLHPKEDARKASERHVEERAGIAGRKLYTEQLYTFDRVDRDPRGRVVAVAFIAFVPWEKLSESERKDTHDAWWSPVRKVKNLAYDHDEVFAKAVERLRSRIAYTTLLHKLLPKEFTLTELENAYSRILGKNLDKRNFRKKILKLKIVTPVTGKRTGGKFRPAQLYRYASDEVKEIQVL